mgnify:CR=1 FL=1
MRMYFLTDDQIFKMYVLASIYNLFMTSSICISVNSRNKNVVLQFEHEANTINRSETKEAILKILKKKKRFTLEQNTIVKL